MNVSFHAGSSQSQNSQWVSFRVPADCSCHRATHLLCALLGHLHGISSNSLSQHPPSRQIQQTSSSSAYDDQISACQPGNISIKTVNRRQHTFRGFRVSAIETHLVQISSCRVDKIRHFPAYLYAAGHSTPVCARAGVARVNYSRLCWTPELTGQFNVASL